MGTVAIPVVWNVRCCALYGGLMGDVPRTDRQQDGGGKNPKAMADAKIMAFALPKQY